MFNKFKRDTSSPVGILPLVVGLGALYSGLELGSSITGKIGTGERWFRGVLATLDIIPGAMAIKKYRIDGEKFKASLKNVYGGE